MRTKARSKDVPTKRVIVFAMDDMGALGGVSSVLMLLTQGFQERGFQVDFLSLRSSTSVLGKRPFEVEKFRHWTADHPLAHEFPGPFKIKLVSKKLLTIPWRLWRDARARKYFRSLDKNTVLIFFKPQLHELYLRLFPEPAAQPVHTIAQFHSSSAGMRAIGEWERYSRLAINCDVFLTLDAQSAAEMSAAFGREVGVMRNPCSLAPSALGESPRQNHVVCLTRFSKEKRLDLMVKAFTQANDQVGREWHLTLWGDGPERGAIERLINSLGAGNQVTLAGVTRDVAGAFSSASLTALTSSFEGLPMSLLEAAACGVPAVCTPASPAVVEIANECGWLVEDTGDVRALNNLSAAFVEAMTSPEERKKRSQACLHLADRHSLDSVMTDWLELLDSLDDH